ncbi:glycine receptor subunit alpha-3-like [Sarcoptes scabiei]|nr:glycine receptor subunit alpha-3-like [Sarcoptes scabiei]
MDRSYEISGWRFQSNRSHILNSKCTTPVICLKFTSNLNLDKIDHWKKTLDEYYDLKNRFYYEKSICLFCKYKIILSMNHLPDMTYAANYLKIINTKSNLMLEFNALDALAPVIIKSYGLPSGLKVSASEAWLKARMSCEYTKNVFNADFDWTFSSDYPGSLSFADSQKDLREDQSPLKELIVETDERIDVEKLKIRHSINFFEEVELFEDELADHGVSKCSVKIRVHDNSFYILCRFFLRIDRILVRYFDTRLYHEFGQNFIIREQSHHESAIADLTLPEDRAQALLTMPQELFQYVPCLKLKVTKILMPFLSNE